MRRLAIRTRPVRRNAALAPLSEALSAGKNAYCSAIEFPAITRRASCCGGWPSETQGRTSPVRIEARSPSRMRRREREKVRGVASPWCIGVSRCNDALQHLGSAGERNRPAREEPQRNQEQI